MTTTFRQSRAHYLGQHAGRAWRWLARVDRRAEAWVAAQGVPAGWAKAVLWGAKIVLLGSVLYVAFWLILLAAVIALAAWLARNWTGQEEEELALADHAEHKKSIFYDPINYNDDSDPRFDDK
ncbi:DUF3742 family protein [Burkholderia pseudomallei]|uniref:DUF3742 family protein n=1 Tax=Burkholderia pseudomallei TaxID=28450 RepID=UPI001E4A39C9|nr:DUF3742 family protein [Burkholderia pseudomallei]